MPSSSASGASPASQPARGWPLLVVFLATLALATWWLTRSWHASLLDHYEFRQLQTALSIWWLQATGLRLDYLTPLFGPPWSIPFEFPLYQWLVALLVQGTGLGLEPAGRLVSLGFFASTLPALYGLAGLAGLAPSRRLLVLAVVLLTPVYLFYPRTVMIETTALSFAVWFLYALQRTLESRSTAWCGAAVLFAVLAALVKITTLVVYCVPAGLLAAAALWRATDQGKTLRAPAALRLALLAALPVLLALGAALWWIARGDAIKQSNPFTQYLTSQALRGWNYGDWSLRLDPTFWSQLWTNLTQNVLGEGALALAAVAATFATPRARRAALICLAGFFCGPLLFANLYHVHDYYYIANALLASGAAGVLLASAWDHPRLPAGSRWALTLLLLVLQYRSFTHSYRPYYTQQAPVPELAAMLRETTSPDDVLLIAGADWNPLLPYYAQRRAIMLTDGNNLQTKTLDSLLQQLPPRRIAALLVAGEWRRHQDWIRERTTYLGLAPHPFAASADTDLYIPLDAIKAALPRLQHQAFDHTQVFFAADHLTMAASQEQLLPARDFIMCTPAPHRSRSQFGISVGTLADQPVIYTHAPSELYFTPPPGSHRITATVGLIPASYAQPLPQASDGVVVEIFEEYPGGLRHTLFRQELDPVRRAADREPHEIKLALTRPFAGELVFVISPGPAGSTAYDQAYWSRIELH